MHEKTGQLIAMPICNKIRRERGRIFLSNAPGNDEELGEAIEKEQSTYALGGDELAVAAAAPLGLPLADRLAEAATGVPDVDGAMRSADGDCATEAVVLFVTGAGGGRSAGVANEGRSWGAGDGAMAMAVLMAEM